MDLKNFAQLVLGRAVRQVSNIKVLHCSSKNDLVMPSPPLGQKLNLWIWGAAAHARACVSQFSSYDPCEISLCRRLSLTSLSSFSATADYAAFQINPRVHTSRAPACSSIYAWARLLGRRHPRYQITRSRPCTVQLLIG